MTTHRKLVRAQINTLGDDEVEVVMSTAALARDGHILLPQGCILDNYRANPIVLWSHDPDKPVGNAENTVVGGDQIAARVRFAPIGISHKADEVRGFVKSGVIRAVSVGFEPIEMEPLDPKKPRGGQRISSWELLELSFVSVPADPGAMVTARELRAKGDDAVADWKVGAAKGLPIQDSDDWDGPAAQKAVFAWATEEGSDEFDPAKARKAFLVYDASAADKRGSYKLPIATVVDGELKVPKGAIRAAASRLPQTDIPDDVKADAQGVLDAYKKDAGIGDDDERAVRVPKTRARTRAANRGLAGKTILQRGVYEVASLCYVFESLGYQVDMAKWESAIEGDASKVPAMLAAVLTDLGDALLAMTQEEISEALAGRDVEPEAPGVVSLDDDVLVVEARAHIAAAKTPAVRAFRRALAHLKLRAGKTLSAETVRGLQEVQDTHQKAIGQHRAAIKTHQDAMGALDDLMDRAASADDDATEDAKIQTSSGVADRDGSENDRGFSPDFRRRQAEALALGFH